MTIRAGDLDRRVTFLRAAPVDDGLANRPGVFSPIGTVWASRKDMSDGERLRAGMVLADSVARFVVRASIFSRGILTSDRLQCDGREYDILGIKEVEGRAGLELTARVRL